MRKINAYATTALIALTLLFVSCGGSEKKDDGGNSGGTQTISVTSVAVRPKTMTLAIGITEPITATVQPSNATDKTVTWLSGNDKIASVSNGQVKGVAVGEVTIYAQTKDGGRIDSCDVKVNAVSVPITRITLDKSTLPLQVGETYPFTATILPSNATNKTLTWLSGDVTKATVSATGQVKGIAVGEVTIYALAQDGSNEQATCRVTVMPKN